jgi:coenzyme F420-0:L-glutamate ligase
MADVKPGGRAMSMALESKMDPKLCELVIKEADYILAGVPGFLLAIKNGMIAPNAGIDRSNVPSGYAILYPNNAFETARKLRMRLISEYGGNVGVGIADSRLMPTRIGTTGVAIACAGFKPVEDLRGKADLFGNVLRVTQKAVADTFATMGVAVMGESNEATPAAIVRGAKVEWSNKKFSWRDMAVAPEIDIYLSARRDLVKISRERV